MERSKILVVDDEKLVRRMIARVLESEGMSIVEASNGLDAVQMAKAQPFDLIILDIIMEGIDGFQVIHQLRSEGMLTPVFILSGRQADNDKVFALGIGADDYITKPFGTSELLARIRTSLRHSNRMASNSPLYIRPYKCQGLILDFEKRMLTLDGEEIHLTPVEYKIVAYLARNSGKVMTYASVMANVWGPFTDNNNRILRVNMANIRRKIERNPSQPQFLFTEVGVGYRMCEDENEV